MEFRILGPLEVVSAGNALPLGGAKQRALLALLLVRRNELVSMDRIVDELWGEQPPPTAAKNVQVYISHLRKALGADALETTPPGYTLRVADGELDVQEAERILAHAPGLPTPERIDLLRTALGLWRGPPLAELASLDFAQAETARLEELRLQLLKRRLDAELELGRHADVLVELERLVAAHPLDEHLRGQLMLALYQSGRQADALAAFRDARRVLRDELGLEPDEELRELERRILAHDPELRAPVRITTPAAEARRGAERRLPPALYVGIGLLLAAGLFAGVLAFTGDEPAAELVVPANSVAVVEPESERIVAAIPVGRAPEQIVATRRAVWVANTIEETLTRIDPRSLLATKTVGLGFEPTGLAADGDSVWVAGGYDHQLWRVDGDGIARVKTTFVERIPQPGGFERGPAGVAVGEGSVWLSHGTEVTEFDRATGEILSTTGAGGRWHPEIVADDGRVWVGVNDSIGPGSNTGVDRIELAATGRVERTELLSNASELMSADRSIWAAIRTADAVWEIDPDSGFVQRTIPAGNLPLGLAFLDDQLWVTTQDEELRRIDVRTGATESVIPFGRRVAEIAASDGRLYVAVRGP